jgi:hypothetical protein
MDRQRLRKRFFPVSASGKSSFHQRSSNTADEATLYSYQPAATSPDGSTVSFSLAQSPEGASVSGSTISWTPTHAQSRNANQFSVTATLRSSP